MKTINKKLMASYGHSKLINDNNSIKPSHRGAAPGSIFRGSIKISFTPAGSGDLPTDYFIPTVLKITFFDAWKRRHQGVFHFPRKGLSTRSILRFGVATMSPIFEEFRYGRMRTR
jgi:hypothetical protein